MKIFLIVFCLFFSKILMAEQFAYVLNHTRSSNPECIGYDNDVNYINIVNTETNSINTLSFESILPSDYIYGDGSNCISSRSHILSANNTIYVSTSESLILINSKTNKFIKSLPIYNPSSMVLSHDGKQIFVISDCGVSIIDTESQIISKEICTSTNISHIAISNNNILYAASSGNTIYAINVVSGKILSTIKTGQIGINWIAVNSKGSRVFATDAISMSISIITTKTNKVITKTLPKTKNGSSRIGKPKGVMVSPKGNFLYIPYFNMEEIDVLNSKNGKLLKRFKNKAFYDYSSYGQSNNSNGFLITESGKELLILTNLTIGGTFITLITVNSANGKIISDVDVGTESSGADITLVSH